MSPAAKRWLFAGLPVPWGVYPGSFVALRFAAEYAFPDPLEPREDEPAAE